MAPWIPCNFDNSLNPSITRDKLSPSAHQIWLLKTWLIACTTCTTPNELWIFQLQKVHYIAKN